MLSATSGCLSSERPRYDFCEKQVVFLTSLTELLLCVKNINNKISVSVLPCTWQHKTFAFLVALCCCKEQLNLPWQNTPPLDTWFLGSSGNFKQLSFWGGGKLFFFFKFFFSSNFFNFFKFFFITLNFFPPCHPECTKKFHPKFFFSQNFFFNALWVKQGATQCCQAV